MAPEVGRDGVILIVDDDQEIREGLRAVLETEGCETAVAAQGEEALAWLGAHAPPGLVLLDLMMPIMDGWQVIDELRQTDRISQVPIVVITAFGRDLGSAAGLPLLRKPIELADLMTAVEQHRRAAAP
jgi:two-component system, chemotaxis family, chemotaxis protein CheY